MGFGARGWREARRLWLACAVLAGCAAGEPVGEAGDGRCGAAAAGGARPIDWAAAPAVEVAIVGGAITPMIVELHRRQPYRLVVVNRDGEERVFAADRLLGHSVQAGLRRNGRPVDAGGCVGTITLAAGDRVELAMIPLRRGRYEVADSGLPRLFPTAAAGVIYVRE